MRNRKLAAWLVSAICLIGGMACATSGGSVTIDVSGAREKGLQQLEGVAVELYRVGERDEGSRSGWRSAAGFEGVEALEEEPGGSAGEWTAEQTDRIIEQAQAAVETGRAKPLAAETDAKGVATFSGLEDGVYYLIKPENAEPRALKMLPALTMIPGPSQEAGHGPVRDVYVTAKIEYEESGEPGEPAGPSEKPGTTEITVVKHWRDGNDFDGIRPAVITARLLRNGESVEPTKELTAENGWAAKWTDLPRTDGEGAEYAYTVTEDVPARYVLAVENQGTDWILENIHEAEKGTLRIRKRVELAGAGEMDEATRIRIGNYLAGQAFVFHVTGPSDADYAGSKKTKVSGGDNPNYVDRDVIIHVDPETLTGEYEFSGSLMPGRYTVKEVTEGLPKGLTLTAYPEGAVEVTAGGEAEASFTNTQELGSLSIVKQVRRNGEATTSAELDGSYVFDVYGPDVYGEGDLTATRTITVRRGASEPGRVENLLPGSYRVVERTRGLPSDTTVTSVDGDIHEVPGGSWASPVVFTVVNDRAVRDTPTLPPSREPEATPSLMPLRTPEATASPTPRPMITLTGEKVWEDEENAHGIRPESVVVNLFANGEKIRTQAVSGKGSVWSFAFEELPEVDAEERRIAYTVTEEPVSGYSAAVEGTRITNTLIPREPERYTSLSGEKSWNDEGNALGLRPNYITVILLRGEEEAERRVVTAASNWQYTFGDLPMDDGYGNEYTYAVREEGIAGYYLRVEGNNLINTQLPNVVPPSPENPPTPGGNPPGTGGNPPTGGGTPSIPEKSPLEDYGDMPEEELEDLIDIFDYATALWGGLLKTGQETPAYPYVFAGIGGAALIGLAAVVAAERRKKRRA